MGILVNGNGNPHVYAHQDSDLIAGIVGNQTSIMPVGDKFEANQEDANTIALSSGVIITKEGRRIQLDAGTIDEFIIPTGAQDVQSFYIIGYHLYEDGNSDQLCETFVRKMDSASDTIPESTFRSGATEVYVSLYRVTQDSLNITDIDLLLPYADSIAEVKRNGGNKNLAAIEDGSTASQPYVKGEFVIVGGQFCKVTASISTNDAFIAYPLPNYNIKAGTVGEQITALNQNLTYRWNPTTDYMEYYKNGQWVKEKFAGFNGAYIIKNGILSSLGGSALQKASFPDASGGKAVPTSYGTSGDNYVVSMAATGGQPSGMIVFSNGIDTAEYRGVRIKWSATQGDASWNTMAIFGELSTPNISGDCSSVFNRFAYLSGGQTSTTGDNTYNFANSSGTTWLAVGVRAYNSAVTVSIKDIELIKR